MDRLQFADFLFEIIRWTIEIELPVTAKRLVKKRKIVRFIRHRILLFPLDTRNSSNSENSLWKFRINFPPSKGKRSKGSKYGEGSTRIAEISVVELWAGRAVSIAERTGWRNMRHGVEEITVISLAQMKPRHGTRPLVRLIKTHKTFWPPGFFLIARSM